jgi:hypothetical protein
MNHKSRLLISALLACAFLTAHPADAQTWSQLSTVGTPSSIDGVINYDSVNNRLILFVPREDTLSTDRVWVLTYANGLGGTATWTQLQPTGSAPTINGIATAVYDKSANQLIVYGGGWRGLQPSPLGRLRPQQCEWTRWDACVVPKLPEYRHCEGGSGGRIRSYDEQHDRVWRRSGLLWNSRA